MEDLSCQICMEEFHETERVPKCLRCGHTVCSQCLSNIKDFCPSCRQTVSTTEANACTNFSLLSLLEGRGKSFQMDKIKSSAKELKKLLEKKLSETESIKEAISSEIAKIDEIIASDCKLASLQETQELLDTIKSRIRDVCDVDSQEGHKHINLKDFKNKAQCLYYVSYLLHKQQKVYAWKTIDCQPKYGRLSLEDWEVVGSSSTRKETLLVMHCFSTNEVGKTSSLILYSDLQKCITATNMSIFLEFGRDETHRLCFAPNISRLVPQFIQLCTGELGPTYQATEFNCDIMPVRNPVVKIISISVNNYLVNAVPALGLIDPYFTVSNIKTNNPGQGVFVIEAGLEGQFKIGLKHWNSEPEWHAIFQSNQQPSVLRSLPAIRERICDCGIALNINSL